MSHSKLFFQSLAGRIAAIGFLAILVMGAGPVARAATLPKEYDLKAAFLFNFVRFVDWPDSVLPPDNGPIVIGVLGEDPFGGALDAIVRGESINHRAIVVKRFLRRQDVTQCQVLYICRSEASQLDALLKQLRGAVLTVSDIDRFAYVGGMIGLVMEQGRVRLQINLDTATASRLAVSAKLLRPALVIRNPPQSMLDPTWERPESGDFFAGAAATRLFEQKVTRKFG